MNFPIIGWAQMPKELSKPEVYANIAASGVNVFMTCSDSKEDIVAQLDLAAEHGIQALVVDPRFRATDKPGWEDATRSAAREYADHPATYGFWVRDEPLRGEFEKEGRMLTLLQDEWPEKVAYVNGLGWGARGADCFTEYVEDYARVIKPKFLSFDAYPISKIPEADEHPNYEADCGVEWPELGAYYRDRYWEAWENYRMVGWKYDLPLWGFVLATPHYHSIWRYGPVTEGTIRLEAFTGLAHGIHALQYFTLPTIPRENWDDGILTTEGAPSVRYECFKNVNKDVAVLGPLVKALKCTRVYHTGPLTSNCCRWETVRNDRDSSHVGIARIDGDPIIIGFLKGESGRYAMIVNRNPGRKGQVKVSLQKGWSAAEISKDDGKTELALESEFDLACEPGDARLLRIWQSQ